MLCMLCHPGQLDVREKLSLLEELLGRLDDQLDSGPHLVFDGHICKLRNAAHVDAIVSQVARCQDECLDCLIDGSCSDGLHFGSVMLTNDTRNGASNGGCA